MSDAQSQDAQPQDATSLDAPTQGAQPQGAPTPGAQTQGAQAEHAQTGPAGPAPQADPFTVLLYSDDAAVRDRIRLAIGTRPAVDLSVEFVDAATWEQCRLLLDDYEIDLMVLDGEAAPAGGLGIARQTKDEYRDPPPTCVVIARAADRWLAAFAQVDATLTHPLDPVTTGQTVAGLLRERRAGGAVRGAIGAPA
jgi:CheY-like chemotaxis protein